MEKRDETIPGQKALATAATVAEGYLNPPGKDGETPHAAGFEWQAVLLRYLPDPRGPQHAVKRFGLR